MAAIPPLNRPPSPEAFETDVLAAPPLAADDLLTAPICSLHPGARIWLLDPDSDDQLVLERSFEASGWQTLRLQNTLDFEGLLQDLTPDLLVLEQQLAEGSGVELLLRLRAEGHRFPVVILSARASVEERIQGLEAGANDYVAKPCAPRELMLRLERLLQYTTVMGVVLPDQLNESYRIGDVRFDPATVKLSLGPQSAGLSRGDSALLVQFCRAPGLILSREQLARGSGSIVDLAKSRSLDMRISKLRGLLNALSPGLGATLQVVRGRGYRLIAPVRRQVG